MEIFMVYIRLDKLKTSKNNVCVAKIKNKTKQTTIPILLHIGEPMWEKDSKRRSNVFTASSVKTWRNLPLMGTYHDTHKDGERIRSQSNRPFLVSLPKCSLGLWAFRAFLPRLLEWRPVLNLTVSPSQCIFTVILCLNFHRLVVRGWASCPRHWPQEWGAGSASCADGTDGGVSYRASNGGTVSSQKEKGSWTRSY